MEPFLKKFFHDVYIKMKEDKQLSNYCKFDSELLTSFTSSLYVAGLFATFVASSVTRAYGRKASILLGGANFLAGAALGGAASNIYMLIIGRVLLGVGVGFANQVKKIILISLFGTSSFLLLTRCSQMSRQVLEPQVLTVRLICA